MFPNNKLLLEKDNFHHLLILFLAKMKHQEIIDLNETGKGKGPGDFCVKICKEYKWQAENSPRLEEQQKTG